MGLLERITYLGLYAGAFYVVLITVLNLLPAGQPLPIEFVAGVNYFFSLVRGLDFLVPMQTFFTVFALSLTYMGIKYGWNIVLWILKIFTTVTKT